ncbi:helix-turn-helix domain-containing protein [Patescibacteria group bacterium]|nr:helix-turn-helix domain-containing protein [Patescibacteria group bacterium]MBU1674006.1 helix-turn-helix domain-containing protein [Patescibacteria group bacterium]MBU1963160.1 helix-turn-helix domain-containing protein [Patescibacteria group bacterium]
MKTNHNESKPLDESLLTVSQVAKLLNLSKTTIYRLVETRQIPHYRISGSLRFSRKEIEEYLRQESYRSP